MEGGVGSSFGDGGGVEGENYGAVVRVGMGAEYLEVRNQPGGGVSDSEVNDA